MAADEQQLRIKFAAADAAMQELKTIWQAAEQKRHTMQLQFQQERQRVAAEREAALARLAQLSKQREREAEERRLQQLQQQKQQQQQQQQAWNNLRQKELQLSK